MPTSKIASKGRTTIPKEVREALDLKSGDHVTWTISEGRVVVTKRPGLYRWRGFVKGGPDDAVEAVAQARKTRGRV